MLLMIGIIASAVVMAALATILNVAYWNWRGNRAALRRQLVRHEQRLAEARAQAILQETVRRMFAAVRDHQ